MFTWFIYTLYSYFHTSRHHVRKDIKNGTRVLPWMILKSLSILKSRYRHNMTRYWIFYPRKLSTILLRYSKNPIYWVDSEIYNHERRYSSIAEKNCWNNIESFEGGKSVNIDRRAICFIISVWVYHVFVTCCKTIEKCNVPRVRVKWKVNIGTVAFNNT